MVGDGTFADLRRLSESISSLGSRASVRTAVQIERITRRLGVTAVPLLGRALRQANAIRREAARDALAVLATTAGRDRVIVELRCVASDASADEAKVCALGLLAELGEHGAARFSDPPAIQRRSALALAAQLETPADVASAADMMVRQLTDDDALQMLEVLHDAAPRPAHRLATELAMRLDLDVEQRARIAALVTSTAASERASDDTHERPRPAQVAVLVDAAARIVVVVSSKVNRRWRRWAVLIGANGYVDDCLHEDDAGEAGDAAGLIASLCADGYRVAGTELDHARTVVATAVRRTATTPRTGNELTSAYYLGRDLLDLRDAHAVSAVRDRSSNILGHATELLAAGDLVGARALLDRAGASDELAGTLAACLLAQGETAAAIAPLEQAIAADPAWPLHHWNLGTALHFLDDACGCYHALRRFVSTSAAPSGLHGDPDQPERIACAERMIAEIERTARLTGTSLARPRRKKRAGR